MEVKGGNGKGWIITVLALIVFATIGVYEYQKHTNTAPKVETGSVIAPCDHRTPKIENDFRVTMMYAGKGYAHTKNGQMVSHCLPCEHAKSIGEKFVCDGDGANGVKN